MKKYFFLFLIVIIGLPSFSQENIRKGKFLIEAGISPPLLTDAIYTRAITGFSLLRHDGITLYSVGSELGYFLFDNFALKVGFGYSDLDYNSYFSYKGGVKYYIIGSIPVQIDITGANRSDHPLGPENPDPLWLGMQIGYAFYLNDKVSFEPSLRSSKSLNPEFTEKSLFEINFGFVLFLF